MSTLEEMKSVDVRVVDRDSLVDINEIRIIVQSYSKKSGLGRFLYFYDIIPSKSLLFALVLL